MRSSVSTDPVIVAFTGASGAAYGLRLLECLLSAERRVYLLYSKASQIVVGMETGLKLPSRPREAERALIEALGATGGQLRVFGVEEWTAPIASGSTRARAMVICPCSCGTLAAIAQGASENLIERAADVMLKERHQLILVLRETPLSVIHLENMLRLARAGAVIMPANPGFYTHPQRIGDLVDFMVARILDHLAVEHSLMDRWGEENE
jgi:4-hydroxy-3-polyprenylbenzoate decarboxylase